MIPSRHLHLVPPPPPKEQHLIMHSLPPWATGLALLAAALYFWPMIRSRLHGIVPGL